MVIGFVGILKLIVRGIKQMLRLKLIMHPAALILLSWIFVSSTSTAQDARSRWWVKANFHNDKFVGCSAFRSLDQVTLSIWVSSLGLVQVSVSGPKQRIKPSDLRTAEVSVDGTVLASTPQRLRTNHLLFELAYSSRPLHELAEGRALTVRFGTINYEFPLDGSRPAISWIMNCTRKHRPGLVAQLATAAQPPGRDE